MTARSAAEAPLPPAYGRASLAELPAAVLAALGVPGGADPLGLAPARSVCLLLIDGLGALQLAEHAHAAPFLAALPGRRLTAGFPATTVTSLATLGTGLAPGGHGMLGVRLAVPGEARMLDCLRWRAPGPFIAPESWQPAVTVFQRAAAAGVRPVYVAPGEFAGTGLTRAVYRGAHLVPARTPEERVAAARQALAGGRAYVTVYYGEVDRAGHETGVGTPEWLAALAEADRLARRLAEELPAGAALYVTADHGMVDITDRVDADTEPALREGVAMLGGDPRCRHVYAAPGAAGAVLENWREALAGRAWVLSREQAVDAGWFGPVRREWLARIGDVVAVPYGGTGVIASAAEPRASAMRGMHGSLTAAEQYVPLLEVSAG